MSASHRKLQMYCDAVNGKFTLVEEGQHWRHTYDTFDDAYEQAEARAAEATSLTIYNERGQVVTETTVSPLPLELVSFRHPLKGDSAPRRIA